MNISLGPETQRLLEEQMKKHGYATPEDAVRVALERMDQEVGETFEEMDAETRSAIEEGIAQAERGEVRPWDEVRGELRARFVKGE